MSKELIINAMDGGGGLYASCGGQERTGIRLVTLILSEDLPVMCNHRQIRTCYVRQAHFHYR
jgi:hypothetical protein